MTVSIARRNAFRNDVKEFYTPERSGFEKNKSFLGYFVAFGLGFLVHRSFCYQKEKSHAEEPTCYWSPDGKPGGGGPDTSARGRRRSGLLLLPDAGLLPGRLLLKTLTGRSMSIAM